jgi:dolichol-phosphate mannosyltransferase
MPNKRPYVSLVIPVHNEAKNLAWHHETITSFMKSSQLKCEVIYVDDGSVDESLSIIRDMSKADKTVRYISFSRNFGKEAATSAGLAKAKGDVVVMLDADGQHPVELVKAFIDKWQQGFPVVIGVRVENTDEGFTKRYGSKLFYKLSNAASKTKTVPGSTDFRLLDRRVVDEFNKFTEHGRITRGLIDWLGYKSALVEFKAPARHAGTASYSFSKLLRLAVSAFVSQSTKPLQLTGVLGALVVSLSAIAGVILVIEEYILSDPLNLAVTGTAILALFVSFLVGIVLISNWLLALYVESIHNETQNRPLYVIDSESKS